MTMSDTPRTDEIYGVRAHAERRVGHGAEKLCCELERENAKLRAALLEVIEDVTHADHTPNDWSEHVVIERAREALKI